MKQVSRRNFIRTSGAVAAGALVLPNIVSCTQKSSVIRLAIIGAGGRGANNWSNLIKKTEYHNKKDIKVPQSEQLNPLVKVVALCDVNDDAAQRAYKTFPDAKKYKDFRVMFDEMHKDIDAVVVSTPDHTHFAATMAAMELGKHVYVEKPLAHNVWQLRTLKKAAKKYGVVNIMGNQGHASNGIRNAKEWYDAGLLGDVKEVIAWFAGPRFNKPGDFGRGYFLKSDQYPPAAEPIPEGLDWDLWLGPTAQRAYSPYYIPRFWRGWYELGNGELGDFACHTLDAPYWALNLGSPSVVEPEFAIRNAQMPDKFNTDQSILRFEFPQRGDKVPVTMRWYEGGVKPENRPEWGMNSLPSSGMIMVGDKMSLMTGSRPNNAKLIMTPEQKKNYNKDDWKLTIPRIENESQYGEFINAILGTGPMPGSDFEYGAGLTEMALLGVIAQRSNKRIEFDDANMKITNHPELNAYIKEPAREGWEYGENLW